MKRLIKIIVIFFLGAIPMSLLAREMHVLPEGNLISCGSEQFYCYNFDEAKKLFVADRDYRQFQLKLQYFEDATSQYTQLNQELLIVLERQGQMLQLLSDVHDELFFEHKKMTEAFLTARSRDIFGGGIYLAIGLGATSFAAGVLLTYFLLGK